MSEAKHRGKVVEQSVRASSYSIKEVAEAIHISRKTLYRYFGQEYLDWDKILKIYQVIDKDVYADFPEAPFALHAQEPGEAYAKKSLEECQAELNRMYRKYTDLLEKYYELKEKLDG